MTGKDGKSSHLRASNTRTVTTRRVATQRSDKTQRGQRTTGERRPSSSIRKSPTQLAADELSRSGGGAVVEAILEEHVHAPATPAGMFIPAGEPDGEDNPENPRESIRRRFSTLAGNVDGYLSTLHVHGMLPGGSGDYVGYVPNKLRRYIRDLQGQITTLMQTTQQALSFPRIASYLPLLIYFARLYHTFVPHPSLTFRTVGCIPCSCLRFGMWLWLYQILRHSTVALLCIPSYAASNCTFYSGAARGAAE